MHHNLHFSLSHAVTSMWLAMRWDDLSGLKWWKRIRNIINIWRFKVNITSHHWILDVPFYVIVLMSYSQVPTDGDLEGCIVISLVTYWHKSLCINITPLFVRSSCLELFIEIWANDLLKNTCLKIWQAAKYTAAPFMYMYNWFWIYQSVGLVL